MNWKALLAALAIPTAAFAQTGRRARATAAASSEPMTSTVRAPAEVHVTTQHSITIDGQRIDYDATVGSIILRNAAGQPTGELYYTAYTKRGVTDESTRPLMFAYNGGPGASSIWVHMGLLGPKRVDIPDAVHAPPPPYRLVDNQYSMLDKADLVFIDPIGTGYSRPVGVGKGSDFWGVEKDANSLAQFITRWLSQNDRWNSPRYIMGESYGTMRSAVLSAVLQQRDHVDLNGVILLSASLDFETKTFNPGNDEAYLMFLPTYAAVAWYHHALPQRPAELRPFLRRVEHFAINGYALALLADSLSPTRRNAILDTLHQYTGLSRDYLDRANLRVTAAQFQKELLREHGELVSRLDARFTGDTGDLLAESANYDPQSVDIGSAYVSLFNQYMHTDLDYGKDMVYTVGGAVRGWDWNHNNTVGGRPGYTNSAVDLARTLSQNPRLHVMLNSGLFDLATPYFASEWIMDHLGVPSEVRARITEAEYQSGHMIYVHVPALAAFKKNVAAFIDATSGVSH
jgi:carboxypeptidase C (cathepsin A)